MKILNGRKKSRLACVKYLSFNNQLIVAVAAEEILEYPDLITLVSNLLAGEYLQIATH